MVCVVVNIYVIYTRAVFLIIVVFITKFLLLCPSVLQKMIVDPANLPGILNETHYLLGLRLVLPLPMFRDLSSSSDLFAGSIA